MVKAYPTEFDFDVNRMIAGQEAQALAIEIGEETVKSGKRRESKGMYTYASTESGVRKRGKASQKLASTHDDLWFDERKKEEENKKEKKERKKKEEEKKEEKKKGIDGQEASHCTT